jgi:hypothetical protein
MSTVAAARMLEVQADTVTAARVPAKTVTAARVPGTLGTKP